MNLRPLKYWIPEILNRLILPSFILRTYRRNEVAESLRESREFWYDKDFCEKIKSRAPYKNAAFARRGEKLREAVAFKWQWRKIRYHWRGVGYGLRDCFESVGVGIVALAVAIYGILFSIPLFIWNWTIWLVIEALSLTPKQLAKLKQINRGKDE